MKKFWKWTNQAKDVYKRQVLSSLYVAIIKTGIGKMASVVLIFFLIIIPPNYTVSIS